MCIYYTMVVEIKQTVISLSRISRRGRNKELEFDNGTRLIVPSELVRSLELVEGMIFARSEFKPLIDLLSERAAFIYGEEILARRAHSIGEFKQKMRRKEIDESCLARVVAGFKEQGFLDDARYARLRIESLLSRKPAGRAFLVADVQRHLVPREIAEQAAQEALADIDETDLAIALLEKRRRAFSNFDIETARRKAYTYLARRAISYPAARRAFIHVFERNNT